MLQHSNKEKKQHVMMLIAHEYISIFDIYFCMPSEIKKLIFMEEEQT